MEDNEMSRETMKAYATVAIDQLNKARKEAYAIAEEKEITDCDIFKITSRITDAIVVLRNIA